MILSTSCHKFTIFSKLYHPYGTIVILQLQSLLQSQIIQIVVSFFVKFCSNSFLLLALIMLELCYLFLLLLNLLNYRILWSMRRKILMLMLLYNETANRMIIASYSRLITFWLCITFIYCSKVSTFYSEIIIIASTKLNIRVRIDCYCGMIFRSQFSLLLMRLSALFLTFKKYGLTIIYIWLFFSLITVFIKSFKKYFIVSFFKFFPFLSF